MSTRSNIYIKLRTEDRNKDFNTASGKTINPNGKMYLYIYCHNDGYPDGVGADLVDLRMTYDEALNFILEGDRSTVGLSYWGWRREENCEPWETDEMKMENDYLYLLDEDTNGNINVMVTTDAKSFIKLN